MKKMEYKITAVEAREIINIACTSWKIKLAKKWSVEIVLEKYITIDEDFYNEMRSSCTTEQNELFDKIFGKVDDLFRSEQLKTGEYMIVTEEGTYIDHIILKTYDEYISIKDPNSTWNNNPNFKGKKINFKYTYDIIDETD